MRRPSCRVLLLLQHRFCLKLNKKSFDNYVLLIWARDIIGGFLVSFVVLGKQGEAEKGDNRKISEAVVFPIYFAILLFLENPDEGI